MAEDGRRGRPRRPGGIGLWFRRIAWAGAVGLWLTPLVAMRYSAEVDWTAFDFIVWGVMLTVAAGAFDLATRMRGGLAYQMGAAVAVGSAFLLVWANLAVGVVGSENEALNLIFFPPLIVGVAGGFVTGFTPLGLSRTLWAMAVIQAITLAVAFAITRDLDALLVAFWVVAWMMAAWLFGKAAGVEAERV